MAENKLADKKILYVVKTMSVGGAERFTYNLCKKFKNIFSQVSVFSSGGIFADELKSEGVRIYNSPIAQKNGLLNYLPLRTELSAFLKNNQFDIIHIQQRYFLPIINSFNLKKTKILYTANNYFDDLFQKFVKADVIVAVSKGIYNNLVDTIEQPKERIQLINYGVNELPNQNSQKRDKGITLGYVGRIIKVKGIFELLEAMNLIKDKHPGVKLIIRGDGDDKNEVIQFIKTHNLQGNVVIKEITTSLEDIYNEIDIMILPSNMNEGLPISILECLMNNVLVITTAQGAVSDIIKNNETGFLLDTVSAESIAEKIDYIIDNYNNFEELKNKGYNAVKAEYSLNDMLEKYRLLYENLIK